MADTEKGHLNVETGKFRCKCGHEFLFLPAEPPESAPYSFNHTECGATDPPGGQTINLVDEREVEQFYAKQGKRFPAENLTGRG